MPKKMKYVICIICMVFAGCTGGAGYLLYKAQQLQDESVGLIAQLEQEVELANEQTDQAVVEAENTKKELKKAKNQINDLKKEKKELEEDVAVWESIADAKYEETPTATPEPTAVATEAPQTINKPDITGLWVDTMSNRTEIYISYRESRPGFDIVINASDGAVTGTEFFVGTDGYDESIGGFPYHGAAYRYEYNNVSYRDNTLISSDMSGVLKYSNDHLYWVDYTNLIAYQNLEFQRK